MTEQLYFDDVSTGDTLAEQSLAVDETQLFFFSAATYNGHRIHYDKEWARETEGYDDVLVHGPLQAALLAKVITDWIGGGGTLVHYSVRNRGVAFPGQELTFGAAVTGTRVEDGRCLVDLDIAASRGDDVLMPGTATVELPRAGGSR